MKVFINCFITLCLISVCMVFTACSILHGDSYNDANNKSIDMSRFASENTSLMSPSGLYQLTLNPYMDGDTASDKILIYDQNGNKMETEECFRKRDTLLVLWDDSLDRIWAYSGDLGVYYWDIEDTVLIVHTYADNRSANVPAVLKAVRPKIFIAS